MKKILFLSSALIMTVCSAFADDTATTDKKITGGAGTCTVDVLGVSDNNATANTIATWSLNDYECAAGQYLDETTLNCTECPVGSYCPGGTFTVEANNSKNACPADYTSDAAATAESECYMGCELACSTNVECPPHSNNCTHSEFKIIGKQFSGETCNAYPSVCPIADFSCDTGYSKVIVTPADIMDFQQLFRQQILDSDMSGFLSCNLLNEDETDGKHEFLSVDNGINDCDFLEPGQFAFFIGEGVGALVYQVVANNYNADTVPGVKSVIYPESPGCDHENCTTSEERYLENANFQSGVTGDYFWLTLKYVAIPDAPKQELLYYAAEEFSSGSLSSETMMGLQNNLSVSALSLLQNVMKNADNLDSEQLENIFNVILFDAMDKVETNIPWVFGDVGDGFTSGNSGGAIVLLMMFGILNWDDLFPDWTGSFCYPHTINIDWNPDNNGEHIKNMCTYDGSITVPSDPVKPGYTFMGWKLLENTTTE